MHKTNFFWPLYFLFIMFFILPGITVADETVCLSNAWISEAPPTATVLAGYVQIENKSEEDVTLIKVVSPIFDKIEMHRSVINSDGMASMEKQTELKIPTGKMVEFKPGSFHLMLFNPDKLLKSGQSVPLSFTFSNGQTFSIEAKVERHNSDQHEHHHHD